MQLTNVQPILLGSDFNAYGMARAFYEEYGLKSQAYASRQLAPTKYSRIIDVHIIPGFSEDPGFIEGMRNNVIPNLDQTKTYILLACGDGYMELIAKHKEELEKHFICPYIKHDLAQKLMDKVSFYEVCEQYDLPYPKTKILGADDAEHIKEIELPFAFPVALKPANSVAWLDVQFEGRKKAFVIETRAEFEQIMQKIYAAGYKDQMICQDFIPGDDSHMRVLNAYVDQNHKVRMMCLGHPLLEDPSPASVGNYMVIMPDYNEEIYQKLQNFLEAIEYTGFANFDMKYDVRDGQYKLFEINLRQGRSSFYCTLGGYNLAKYLVEDRVLNEAMTATVYGRSQKVWLGVPVSVFKKYAKDNQYKEEALAMIKAGEWGTTAFYDKDRNIKREILMRYAFWRFKKGYKQYFKER